MAELVESLEEELEKKGYKYDFDLYLWYTEGKSLEDGRTVDISIPPFGITDKQLYERLLALKDERK